MQSTPATDPRTQRCPCGISLDNEEVDLAANRDGKQYRFRSMLCPKHAAEMRAYWDEHFHGSR